MLLSIFLKTIAFPGKSPYNQDTTKLAKCKFEVLHDEYRTENESVHALRFL